MALVSLLLGIASLVLSFLPCFSLQLMVNSGLIMFICAVVCGIVGIVLGALGKKTKRGLGIAGMVVSIIATVFAVIFLVACAGTYAAAGAAMSAF